jgi:hypothetical protein
MELIMNVYQKLNAARKEFHSMEIKKTGHNKFAGYYYFELGDFVVPALTIFEKNGLTAIVSFNSAEATLSIIDNEKPEDKIVIASPMSEANLKGAHAIQNLGAVQSYLRRYLWVAALEIVEHDALDSSEGAAVTIDVNMMADHITAINDATDEPSLIKAYQAAYKACGTDKAWQKKIIGVKDVKKAALK